MDDDKLLMSEYRKGNLIVISGPSGVGKGSIRRALPQQCADIVYSISATTRKPRLGEKHGLDYFFYSEDEFQKMIQGGTFLEWAKVYENYYGTPISYVEKVTAEGKDCILEIDVQGAMQIKARKPDGVFVFIAPPSKKELFNRIKSRGTENQQEISKRMNNVEAELALLPNYDYVVVNDELERAVEMIRCIIMAERAKIKKSN